MGEATETAEKCQQFLSFPVVWLVGSSEMPTASCVPLDTLIPQPKNLSPMVCSQGGPRVTRRTRSSTDLLCCFLFLLLLFVESLDVKIQTEIKETLKKSPDGSRKRQLLSPGAAAKGRDASAQGAEGRELLCLLSPRKAQGLWPLPCGRWLNPELWRVCWEGCPPAAAPGALA